MLKTVPINPVSCYLVCTVECLLKLSRPI
uniref:Uncharacterized protein n=1 Tax=Arundo donax TaxID=35708 RepID=A0A0A8ZNW4_ARUDO